MKQIKTLISQKSVARLDKFLVDALKADFELSRATIQKLINSGQVTLNHQPILVSKTPITEGDEVTIVIPQVSTPTLTPKNLDLEIIYQDDDLLVINKPNNLVVHPGAANETETLVNGLLALDTDLSDLNDWRPGIVHRLDKQTTGLLIVAKNNSIHQKLSSMFANHQVNKEYLALVSGVIKEAAGKIEMPIGRSATNRKKMAVISKNGKQAITHFEVLERFENATLVKINLETGRTHQIRVHFGHIQHPVFNDPVYSSVMIDPDFGQFLHAARLSFKHPKTQKTMVLSAPLPQKFTDKIKELREKQR